MPGPLTRIFSDLHFGDRSSRVCDLDQLRPLFRGTTALIFNGDTIDTRTGPAPAHTAELRAQLAALLPTLDAPVTLLTGNHDPDLTSLHSLELAADRVFVTHGDILFDDIVPWSNDALEIRRLLAAALRPEHAQLAPRLALWRDVAARIPQRHQSERHPLKYTLRFAADTVWPPIRLFRLVAAWRRAHSLAGRFAQRHRPAARFILTGHTHRPGIARTADGVISINTGSFCPPLGGTCVELTTDHLRVRRIEPRDGAFHLGPTLAEFSLAPTEGFPTLAA